MVSQMTREQYFEFHKELCVKALKLSIQKNHDYSGGEDGSNPFQNFMFVEHMKMNVSAEQGFLVRLADKFKRLSGFCKTGEFQVSDESFEDTCVDIINYICLLSAYMHSKRKNEGI